MKNLLRVLFFLIFLLAFYYLFMSIRSQNISSFQECLDAGYPIMESYPRQCRTDNDKVFIEVLEGGQGLQVQLNQEVNTGSNSNQGNSGDNAQEDVFCTMDAMMCPDGSYVGRVGPNCEFAACN